MHSKVFHTYIRSHVSAPNNTRSFQIKCIYTELKHIMYNINKASENDYFVSNDCLFCILQSQCAYICIYTYILACNL